MRILYFTGYASSHIIPLISTIKYLSLQKNVEILLYVTEKNKPICQELNLTYIVYPEHYWDAKLKEESKKYDNLINEEYKKRNFDKMLYYIYKQDAMLAFNYDLSSLKEIKQEIERVAPDVVFRDSTDIYWKYLEKTFPNIKTIGYITNNLYSIDYLNKNKDMLSYYLGVNDILHLISDSFLDHYWDYINRIYDDIQKDYNVLPINPHFQFDPNEDNNIIYTLDFLQPMDAHLEKKSILIGPSEENFILETEIPTSLISFIADNQIIYLSSGSFISRNLEFYKFILPKLIKLNYKIVISAGNTADELKAYCSSCNYTSNVYVDNKIPQKYVLTKAVCFISSGGMNSIKEAIYYKVPMFIIPISCEQRLNGILLQKMNIGKTSMWNKAYLMNFSDTIRDLINDKKIKNNLLVLSNNIKEKIRDNYNESSYKQIWGIINANRNN